MTSSFRITGHMWCMARLTTNAGQSAGGNAEKDGAWVLHLCPSLHCLPLTDIPWPTASLYTMEYVCRSERCLALRGAKSAILDCLVIIMAAQYGRPLYFAAVVSIFFLLFLAYSQPSQIGCQPYFHTWRGFSANLECMFETCHTWLTENTGCKNYAKNGRLRTITQLCRAISSQLPVTWTKARIDNRKKNLLNSNISSVCPHVLTIWRTSAHWRLRSVREFGASHLISTGFASWQRYCTALVGVSQTLRRWTDGATYIRQGGHHVGHWPTF